MITSLVDLAGGAVPWFPQEHATAFYFAKGVLALLATVLLIWHMSRTWPTIRTLGQRLRYLSLLATSSLITFASAEQSQQTVEVNYRNLGAIIVTAILIAAAVVSLREDRTR